jgi:hypothetical protein
MYFVIIETLQSVQATLQKKEYTQRITMEEWIKMSERALIQFRNGR